MSEACVWLEAYCSSSCCWHQHGGTAQPLLVSPDWATESHQIHICSVPIPEPVPICRSSASAYLCERACCFTARPRWLSPAAGVDDGFFLPSSASCLLVFRGAGSTPEWIVQAVARGKFQACFSGGYRCRKRCTWLMRKRYWTRLQIPGNADTPAHLFSLCVLPRLLIFLFHVIWL